MAKNDSTSAEVFSQKLWAAGLSNYPKEEFKNGFAFAQSIDYRTDPMALTLLPRTIKESATNVTDLLKWADTTPQLLTVYAYGNAGNIYSRTVAGSWTKLRTVSSSHGNGLQYFFGDDYLYYTTDSTIGRYGPLASTPQFSDDFLTAQGGVPANTASLSLLSASSQYATAADSASLSVTGDLTLEVEFKATTLPAVGSSMTLIGKWDESTNLRSYKLDIYGVSGYFGDGSDGTLTVSVDSTESPVDSACTGTSGTQALSATNASFVLNQVILIHQSRGTGAGKWERNVISGYTAGTITLATPLINSYTSGAQVRVLRQYTNVTINGGVTLTAKAWDGTVGGILSFLANGTVTVTGTISASSKGYRGASNSTSSGQGTQGEGTAGAGGYDYIGNGSGGGGGTRSGSSNNGGGGGGGGGHAAAGNNGNASAGGHSGGGGGGSAGTADLTTLVFGGGGGGGGCNDPDTARGGAGGNGGGIIFITGVTVTVTGAIASAGANGSNANDSGGGGGGAGAGGSIFIKAQTATLGTNLLTVPGASGGSGSTDGGAGASSSVGRIHADYYTSISGTSSPTAIDSTQDNTLVTTTTYQARLGISNNGTSFEYLTKNLTTLTTATWNRLSVSWTASTSTAAFYLNAVSLGTSVGTKTAISDNASLLYLGADKTTVVTDFFNGLIDDVRIWGNVQTAGQIYANNSVQLTGSEGGLKAYYTLNSVTSDTTANANNLTLVGSPSYSVDVPFPSPSTRLDIDQSATTGTTNTYTLPTSVSESSSDMLSFTPDKDPQKSMAFKVDTKGTGDWTLTIHDQQNNVVATKTITNANVSSAGYLEFIFATPWRIVIGKTYHAHLTVSTGTSSVIVLTASNFSTANYYTYFSFLVADTNFHPIARMLNKIIIGNERYLATWDGAFYSPNTIAFPPNTHVRCYAYWREYIAFGVWQEKSDGTGNIYDYPAGKIYFWDGISLTFNFSIDVAEGQVNAMYGLDDTLYIVAGWNGDIIMYNGGVTTMATQTNKVKRIPQVGRSAYLEIYPQAFNMWRSLLHIGVGANTSSTTLPQGVYSYGTVNKDYPDSLSFDYPISTGNIGSTVKIGMIYPAGRTLLIGWQDGSAYGCDQVTFTNPPYAYGTLQGMITDGGRIWGPSELMKVRVDHSTLLTGEGITAKYKIDRQATWQSTDSLTDTNMVSTSIVPKKGRGGEYQIAFDITATGSTSPTIYGLSALINQLDSEQQF